MSDTAIVDLAPQARILAGLVVGVPDARLAGRTPCPAYAVSDLLGHLAGLAAAFRDAGRKDLGPTTDTAPGAAAPSLPADWREELPRLLGELAEAWKDPAAWTGMTRAGGVDLPGDIAGAVAVDELVIHGWDLARSTGQEYAPDGAALRASHAFLLASVEDEGRGEIFGAVVPVPDDAPLLDRAVGLSGRDPGWTAPRSH
ncbi:TIGR03086 family metal-binding protein [Streptomyces sp. NBC_00249]|uniref:TIGR03086 family metal-binding protein n=1 Tax=Streptomyces sp. NBC_00249 TaxID=2975690 RepID=UPI00225A71F5|nr:TIGR03086 family metal-binding protein [Streptomyces sp. NBC_00249]MCX5195621.1 TIGR03086 family metal-binding protein [Streptomyces sp. NBC_00249]